MSWKAINANPDYFVNENGNVFSKKTNKILKGVLDKDGYLKVHFWNEKTNKYANYYVHRLVLETFIGMPTDNKTEVHHKNGIRNDNRLENLCWVSRKENDSFVEHSINSGSYTPVPVQQLDLQENLIKEYPSITEASRQTGCDISKISLVCSGKRKTTGGYKWKKVESSTTISSMKSCEMGDSLIRDEDIV